MRPLESAVAPAKRRHPCERCPYLFTSRVFSLSASVLKKACLCASVFNKACYLTPRPFHSNRQDTRPFHSNRQESNTCWNRTPILVLLIKGGSNEGMACAGPAKGPFGGAELEVDSELLSKEGVGGRGNAGNNRMRSQRCHRLGWGYTVIRHVFSAIALQERQQRHRVVPCVPAILNDQLGEKQEGEQGSARGLM